MRWVTYDGGAGPRAGVLDGENVRGLPPVVTVLSLLEGGDLEEAGESARREPVEVRPLSDVRLLAPIPRPPSVRDGLCFLDHLRGCRRAMDAPDELPAVWSQAPAFYFASPAAVVGPYDDVVISPGSTMFDLELELGAVIGRPGRDLHPDRAESHIVGYTLYNDWTARDLQQLDMAQGIGMGKSKDGAITLGPALVTVDELEPYRRDGRPVLEMSAEVNGVELARGTLDQMDWTFGELLAYLSRGTDLRPGDVIGSGTVPGGCLLEHVDTPDLADFSRWLRPGDVVSLHASGIGSTEQTVRPAPGLTPLRTRAARTAASTTT
ncbi:fumarylacetoacetate hydrolase family protein [Pseudonocardia parietis]|uniref:2-keto-4-pentenoate hydratase/2-oxohepta-3-ene-1,7-dioic acid hydratase in catechol pathway n=1 Tax=Pseudonocardia parietis TaxID=570936 RepID=A0ABS4W4E0_9PSEU|nr:fumarylacetoacetate hydrolase family protein [Pseudonocardia parietis]MBP2371069.1 2-keto-4-pentenoate hydratase/2-oxohepta-3-ene-1,7-dioic acid hydratase in catechol pathway [Pseudonocardia parietis]